MGWEGYGGIGSGTPKITGGANFISAVNTGQEIAFVRSAASERFRAAKIGTKQKYEFQPFPANTYCVWPFRYPLRRAAWFATRRG